MGVEELEALLAKHAAFLGYLDVAEDWRAMGGTGGHCGAAGFRSGNEGGPLFGREPERALERALGLCADRDLGRLTVPKRIIVGIDAIP